MGTLFYTARTLANSLSESSWQNSNWRVNRTSLPWPPLSVINHAAWIAPLNMTQVGLSSTRYSGSCAGTGVISFTTPDSTTEGARDILTLAYSWKTLLCFCLCISTDANKGIILELLKIKLLNGQKKKQKQTRMWIAHIVSQVGNRAKRSFSWAWSMSMRWAFVRWPC